MAYLPQIEIEYCRQCRWLLRAGWMAQELLVTFEDELGGVTLVSGSAPIATPHSSHRPLEPGPARIKAGARLVDGRVGPGSACRPPAPAIEPGSGTTKKR